MTSSTFQLEELVNKFKTLRILVAGDPMYDIYHFGHVDRMCPEAPVPVFVEDQECQIRRGGAANVAQNLKALGCEVDTLFPSGEWVEKHRYMVGGHMLMRVDRERNYQTDWFNEAIHRQVPAGTTYQAAIISDYAKGSCTEENCQWLIDSARNDQVPVIVDPKGNDWNKYAGARVICPNHKEMAIEKVGQVQPVFEAIVEKRGANGILLQVEHSEPKAFAARAKHVFDVTGAGDTVTAVVAAVVAAGGTLSQACELANLAAAVVVGEVGTSTCSNERLIQEIYKL